MNTTTDLITNLGVMGIVLIGIAFFGKWWLKHLDKQEEERKTERGKERVEREKMVTGFIETCNGFNQTMNESTVMMQNHLPHQEKEFREMRSSVIHRFDTETELLLELTEQVKVMGDGISRLCKMWENGSH